MNEWIREGYTVEERPFDADLHCFAVLKDDGEEVAVIYPADLEQMASIVEDLDAGADVDGWEDGLGNTIRTGGAFR